MRLLALVVIGLLSVSSVRAQAQLLPPCGNCSPMMHEMLRNYSTPAPIPVPNDPVMVAPCVNCSPIHAPSDTFTIQTVPPEDRSWHLLQQQYNGAIYSVQPGLTKHECDFAAARAMGQPATDEEKTAAKSLENTQVGIREMWYETNRKDRTRPDEIASAECFQ